MSAHVIRIEPNGDITCLWTEAIPLAEFGQLEINRASTIEFDGKTQVWQVRLEESPETVVFAHKSREACLQWEHAFFNQQLSR